MPPAPRRSDTRPAEQVLEDLLKAWPSSAESRVKTPPRRRPFATAFLPEASHQAPRLPVFRVQTTSMVRVDLRPMPGRGDGEWQPGTVVTPSFRAVADAVEARAADSATAVHYESAADEVSRLAPTSPFGSDDYRFAAQVVALKAAGVLDAPAASGGSSPAASYADLYAEDAEAGGSASLGPADDPPARIPALAAIIDLDLGSGDLDRACPREGGPALAFAPDDDATPAPRSIYL